MGRRCWIVYPAIKDKPIIFDVRVLSLRRVLPAGPVAAAEPPSIEGHRLEHLIQINTDPGGIRTLAAREIFLKDPRKKKEVAGRAE